MTRSYIPSNIPSDAAIRHQQQKQQRQPDNSLYAPRPYDPDEDARFQYRPVPPEKKESSYTFDIC
jgi:hypothetical protein